MDLFKTEPGVYHAVGVVRRTRGPGDEIGESYEHWRRAVTVMVGRLGSLRRDERVAPFVSVAVPAPFADALLVAARKRGGLQARLAPEPHGPDAASRLLHLWSGPKIVPVVEAARHER